MTSYTLQVQPQTQYTIEYSNQRGPQGPTGAAGAATTDASLLVSGTLSDARLSANVLLASSIGVSVQAWDADLDAIAALATTATGRALLTESVSQTGTGALVRAAGPTLTGTTSVATLTASGTGNFAGALTVTSYIYSDRITTPSFVLNSNGSNYGQIYRKDTTRWGLGYGASLGVTGSDSLLWGSTGVDVTGNLTASGTLRVGGGTVVANILSATATLDFGSIGSNGTETLTITVTGAVAGDSVFLGVPAGLDAGLVFCASVTAANTVTVRMHNSSGGSIDPASGTFRATVIRF
jgi:hypothetical protein